jgi:hypothetical protein
MIKATKTTPSPFGDTPPQEGNNHPSVEGEFQQQEIKEAICQA